MHSEWIWINNEIKSPTDGYIIYVPAIPQRDSWMMKLKPNSLIKYETPQFLFHFLNTFSFFLRIVRAFPTEELLLICMTREPASAWRHGQSGLLWVMSLHEGDSMAGFQAVAVIFRPLFIYLFIYYMSFVYSSGECYLFGITFFFTILCPFYWCYHRSRILRKMKKMQCE